MSAEPGGATAPVQRLVGLGSPTNKLYYVKAKVESALGDKKSKIGQWETNVLALLPSDWGLEEATAISWSDFQSSYALEDDAKIKSQLRSVSAAAFYYYKSAFAAGNPHAAEGLFQPGDLLDEEDDLATEYDTSLGCVLQALVNAGVPKPEGMEGDATNAADWHNHYYNTKGIVYDSDVEIFKIYTDLGLKLVLNKVTKWKDLGQDVLKSGWYVFSMPGHNFAVKVDKSKTEPRERYAPRDLPQRRILRYAAEQTIKYIWKV